MRTRTYSLAFLLWYDVEDKLKHGFAPACARFFAGRERGDRMSNLHWQCTCEARVIVRRQFN